MSIFATIYSLEGTLEYQGSSDLPEDWHAECGEPRGIEIAAIPSHVKRDGLPHGAQGERKPWLRFQVWGDDTVILPEDDVRQIHTALGRWLSAADDGGKR